LQSTYCKWKNAATISAFFQSSGRSLLGAIFMSTGTGGSNGLVDGLLGIMLRGQNNGQKSAEKN
jgi:hypothetical protein